MMRRLVRVTERLELLVPSGILGDPTINKQRALLRLLAVAKRENLNVATLVRNLAAEYPGRYGRKLMNVERWTSAGSSLVVALTQTPGALDQEQTLAIQCASDTDLMAETLDSLVRESDRREPTGEPDWGLAALLYVTALLGFAILVAAFIMIFIMPTFGVIFDEFGLDMPGEMDVLLELSRQLGVWVVLLLMLATGLMAMLFSERVRMRMQNSLLGRLWPPLRERRRASFLRLLALPTQLDKPIAPTVMAAAHYHPDQRWRRRLLQARTESETEAELWIQLERQGLIARGQSEQLSKLDRTTLRAWALRTLAEHSQQRSELRSRAWIANLQAVPVIIIGLFVGWVVLAVMHTLTGLIHSLA